MSSFVTDVCGGTDSRFLHKSFPGTISIRRCLATESLRSQASRDGNNFGFSSSDCEHNLIRKEKKNEQKKKLQYYRQHHSHPVDPVK